MVKNKGSIEIVNLIKTALVSLSLLLTSNVFKINNKNSDVLGVRLADVAPGRTTPIPTPSSYQNPYSTPVYTTPDPYRSPSPAPTPAPNTSLRQINDPVPTTPPQIKTLGELNRIERTEAVSNLNLGKTTSDAVQEVVDFIKDTGEIVGEKITTPTTSLRQVVNDPAPTPSNNIPNPYQEYADIRAQEYKDAQQEYKDAQLDTSVYNTDPYRNTSGNLNPSSDPYRKPPTTPSLSELNRIERNVETPKPTLPDLIDKVAGSTKDIGKYYQTYGGASDNGGTGVAQKYSMSSMSPYSVSADDTAELNKFLKNPFQYSKDKSFEISQTGTPVEKFMNDPGSNPQLRDTITTVVSLPELVYTGYSALNLANSLLDKAVGNAVPDFGKAFRTNTSNIEDVPMEDFYNVGANSNALIKFNTGMDLTDPNINQKLIDDVNIFRVKYNLPPRQMLSDNPREYLDQVSALAKKEGIQIRSDNEVGGFFEQNPFAGGVTLSPSETGATGPVISAKTVNVFTGKRYLDTLDGITDVARSMAHEYIHGVQELKYVSMPVETMEYEAYMAVKNTTILRDFLPADIEMMLTFPKMSIEHYYQEIGQIPLYLK